MQEKLEGNTKSYIRLYIPGLTIDMTTMVIYCTCTIKWSHISKLLMTNAITMEYSVPSNKMITRSIEMPALE